MPDWLDSIKNAIAGQAVGEMKPPSGGVVPFVTEVCRYFMDFIETDFRKVRNPKRNIQHRNKKRWMSSKIRLHRPCLYFGDNLVEKHADRDSEKLLSLETIDNDLLLTGACASYVKLMGEHTPETEIYVLYRYGDNPKWRGSEIYESKAGARFRELPPEKRREYCLKLLEGHYNGLKTLE